MTVCAAIKPDGARCKTRAMTGSQWCFNHHPAYSEERRRNASKGGKRGGRGRAGPADARNIQAQIRAVIDDVLAGKVVAGTGAVAFQGFNCLLRALEVERKMRELDEFEERIAALEETARKRATGQWGTYTTG